MLEVKEIGHRAIKSILALISRTFILNVVNFLGTLALTIFLSTQGYGIFIVASSAVDVLTYFSDIGLAGALIQKKGKLTDKEINSTFSLQNLLVLMGIGLALILSKKISQFYGFGQEGLHLYYALLVAFFFASLKTIPSVLLERRLKLEKVIIPQILETVVFNGLIVWLAFSGWGISSYIVAVIARAVVGVVAIYSLVSWRPRLRLSFESIKSLLSFGVPYQLNSILAVFKDKVSLLVLAKIIGLEGVGILGWAEKWANLILRYFLDSTIKVAFPMFSRLQDAKDKLRESLEHAVYFISLFVFPALTGAYLLMPTIVKIIPKYLKWQAGIPAFNLFLISAGVASISTFLTNFLTATGKVKQVLLLMLMWTGLTLGLYPLLSLKLGFYGVAVGSVIIALTSVIPWWLVKKQSGFELFANIYPAVIASLLMLATLKPLQAVLPISWIGFGVSVVTGIIVYGSAILLINKDQLMGRVSLFLKYVRR